MKHTKIGIFLPQFHHDPVNNLVWGEDFTDWVTTRNNRPRYKGHIINKPCYEYNLASEIDLMNQIRKYTETYGVNAISFYDYTFEKNRSALKKPLNLFLQSSHNCQFCLWWVNVNWTKSWIGKPNDVIVKQDNSNEFLDYLVCEYSQIFADHRYLHVNGKPLLIVHRPDKIDTQHLINLFEKKGIEPYLMAPDHGLKGQNRLIDEVIAYPPGNFFSSNSSFGARIVKKCFRANPRLLEFEKIFFQKTSVYEFREFNAWYTKVLSDNPKLIPTVFTGWDNTPRYGYRGYVIHPPSVREWNKHLEDILASRKNSGILFVKALNEWAEGNTIEAFDNDDYYKILRDLK